MKIKGTLLSLSLLLSMNVYSKSFWDSSKEVLKDYGLPCALAIGVSHLLAKEDKMAIGAAACAGAAGVTYLKNRDIKKLNKQQMMMDQKMTQMHEELKTEVKRTVIGEAKNEMIMEMKQEVYSEINKSLVKDKEFIGKMLSQIKGEFEEYKKVIDQVLSEKLVDYRGEISKEIETALIDGPFISLLEEKMKMQLKDEHTKVLKANKKDIVKKCVEDALSEIVVKEIAVQK